MEVQSVYVRILGCVARSTILLKNYIGWRCLNCIDGRYNIFFQDRFGIYFFRHSQFHMLDLSLHKTEFYIQVWNPGFMILSQQSKFSLAEKYILILLNPNPIFFGPVTREPKNASDHSLINSPQLLLTIFR